jgi:hypothetical protein
LTITALGMYDLSIKCAEELLEVYKGVVPEYTVCAHAHALSRMPPQRSGCANLRAPSRALR